MRLHLKAITLVATLLATLLSTFEAEAQVRFTYRDSLGTYKVKFYPRHINTRSEAESYNIPVVAKTPEIRVGIGAIAYTPLGYTTDNAWEWNFNYGEREPYESFSSTRWYTTTVDAGSWLKEWLFVGGTMAYTGGFRTYYNVFNNKRIGSYNLSCFSLMPMIRFAWVRRGIVQLYSGLGLGLSVTNYRDAVTSSVRIDTSYDFTAIGISVGREFFGYFDLGAGSRGVFSVGVGWRINNK